MSGYQVVITYDDRSWDSIRDNERQTLHKVAQYMKKDFDPVVVNHALVIQDKLVFGHSISSITEQLAHAGFELVVKYIP